MPLGELDIVAAVAVVRLEVSGEGPGRHLVWWAVSSTINGTIGSDRSRGRGRADTRG